MDDSIIEKIVDLQRIMASQKSSYISIAQRVRVGGKRNYPESCSITKPKPQPQDKLKIQIPQIFYCPDKRYYLRTDWKIQGRQLKMGKPRSCSYSFKSILPLTFSIRNVGQVMSTFVSVYYLAKYKYFAFIFSSLNAKFYIQRTLLKFTDLLIQHKRPMFFIHCQVSGFSFRKLASVGVKALLNL